MRLREVIVILRLSEEISWGHPSQEGSSNHKVDVHYKVLF